MANPDVINMSPEYPLLGLLLKQPTHGYELHQRLETVLGQIWRVSLSQVYNILNRLENQGYICGEVEEQDSLPNRRTFHLTAAGRQRLENWLRGPCGSSIKAVRVDFLTRLHFARQIDPRLAAALIEQQAAAIRRGLEDLQAQVPAAGRPESVNRLGLALRIRQLDSAAQWLDEIVQQLNLSQSAGAQEMPPAGLREAAA